MYSVIVKGPCWHTKLLVAVASGMFSDWKGVAEVQLGREAGCCGRASLSHSAAQSSFSLERSANPSHSQPSWVTPQLTNHIYRPYRASWTSWTETADQLTNQSVVPNRCQVGPRQIRSIPFGIFQLMGQPAHTSAIKITHHSILIRSVFCSFWILW